MPELAPAFKVSVVIPAFNAEKYLAAAIESVLAQTIRPAEIIVVDDGSTDGTASVAERFGSPVSCHRRAHHGIAATRNFGVYIARGNWLAFLDADDLWMPDKLERQMSVMRKDLALEIIFGGVQQFVSLELSAADQLRLAAPPAASAAPHAGTMLARRAVFHHLGPFDDTLKVGEFIEWFARAQDAGVRMTTVPEIVLKRRRHLTNTTLKQNNSLAGMTIAMKRILDRRRQSIPSLPP
ncbi:MAG: glycosyltransferase family A protein [Limisphaerales bacterium]